MANENVPAPAPTRSDDQILPFAAWVPIGKSNFLDETRFVLDTNLLREALEITPIDQAHQFVSPPSGDAIMDFVNELGKDFWVCPTKKGRKVKPHVIPYCRFTKLIICHLGRTHNIHQRSASPFHLAEEDLRLGTHHTTMLTGNGLQSNDQKLQPKRENKETSTAKQLKPKPIKEKSSKPAPALKPKREAMNRPLPVVEGKGKAIATEEQAAQLLLALHTQKRRSATDQFIFQRRTPATEEASTGPSAQPHDDTSANIVRDSPSPTDAETSADIDKTDSGGDTEILQIGKEQSKDVANLANLEEKIAKIDEGQDGSDPGKTPEYRPPPDDDKMDED
ncbi:hypothetical protein Tco_0728354 [Tanacetum coccineum]|uniref:Uncharacterized protein n=1 Tax=Tanacetum coccineum TaxID=301880 RepID=A0ABQ4YP53_9ASTR